MKDLPEVENGDDKFTAKERRMYKLIWETSLESCMSKAEYFSLYSELQSKKDNEKLFNRTNSKIESRKHKVRCIRQSLR
jgi:DNA topoisomerase IA